MEQDTMEDFFVEGETIIDVEEDEGKPFSVCSNCLGTGYKMTERNGVLGVLYTTIGETEGKPKKQIIFCNCKSKAAY